MHTIESKLNPQELHRQILAEADPEQRAEAIAAVRFLIEEERSIPHSAEERAYLTVSEMILNFLEELPAPRKS